MSAAIPMSEFQGSEDTGITHISLDRIVENPMNPRTAFKDMEDLTESVRARGVLQPIMVRPKGDTFEIIFGARRFKAAEAAGLETIPAMVKDLGDPEALEIMIIENAKRSDVHELDEAFAFNELHLRFEQDVETIAGKVVRSVAYVYDRMKLLSLTPDAQYQFREGMFTVSHAIQLARLTPEQQAQAIDPNTHALYEDERPLFRTAEQEDSMGPMDGLKARSVREFSDWVDKHCKLDIEDESTPLLFPELVETVKKATEEAVKVVHVTREFHLMPADKEGQKIYGPNLWREANEACDHAVTGVVVIGEGRGKALQVCLAKKECKAHWADEIKQAKQRAQLQGHGAGGTAEKEPKQDSWQVSEAKRVAENKRWDTAMPSITAAVNKKIATMSVAADGDLAKFIVDALSMDAFDKDESPTGIIRAIGAHLALEDSTNKWNRDQFIKGAKAIGLDLKKLLDEFAPVEKPKKEKPAKEAKDEKKTKAKAKDAKADKKPKAKAKKAKAVKGASAL